MKHLTCTIFIILCFWSVNLTVNAAETGIAISPAVIEATTKDKLTTEITNKNQHSTTIKLTPWLFKSEENRITPLTPNQVNEYDLSYIVITPRDFELETNSSQTIQINVDKDKLIQDYLTGVLVTASNSNGTKINTQVNGSIIILNRGNVKGESIIVNSITKPTWTFKSENALQIDIANDGDYISKPTGEIQIYDSFNKLAKTIPITAYINQNLSPTEKINLETTYHLPIKGLFDKTIEKYKINVIITGQNDKYTQTSYVYYINPLIIFVLAIITILIVAFTIYKFKKAFQKELNKKAI